MTKYDVIFIDNTTPKPYEQSTLEHSALGGTEATVIRVAEALGFIGLKTAVFQHNQDMPVSGKDSYYLPFSMLDDADPEIVVMLRGVQFVDKFPRAKKISWHEDDPSQGPLRETLLAMRDTFIKYGVTVVGASKWHAGVLSELLCYPNETSNPKVTYIYNPVPDQLYVPRSTDVKYYPHKLVWPASPHKGLERAMGLVERLVDVSGDKDYRLYIFNPGYFGDSGKHSQYVVNCGAVPCKELWQHMSESLCVFYPTEFRETFGCIAAEANAVHTPVLTHNIAALAETVAGRRQFCERDDKSVIDTVMKWRAGERPTVYGQDRFRLSEVIPEWVKLFKRVSSYD
jgi:glycosyltransferase involved in cell wall biosynthesis